MEVIPPRLTGGGAPGCDRTGRRGATAVLSFPDGNSSSLTAPLRVTVIIPACNVGRFIDDALASVAAQTRPADEVVVVDDGSTDDTNARIRSWSGRMGTTRLILLEGPNHGLSVSRNRAIMASSGDLFAFLDADDCFLPRHLERLVPAFEAEPRLAVVFGDMMRFQDGGEELGGTLIRIRDELHRISTPIGATSLLLLGPELRRIYLQHSMIVPSSWILSREAVALAGLFDPTAPYGEDIDFLWRVLGVGPGAWHDGVTARRREHGNNASDPSRAEWSEPLLLRAVARLRNFTPKLTLDEVRLLDRYIQQALWVTGWLAAGRGLTPYFEWRREARRWTGKWVPLRPKQVLRALLSRFR